VSCQLNGPALKFHRSLWPFRIFLMGVTEQQMALLIYFEGVRSEVITLVVLMIQVHWVHRVN
jgi:hypothetical protein